ncbi:MAG: ribonuclease P protein component [Hyphomicrobiales bacterium]|nr:ribonuclease P protein component [Hyphomicrobiales bacterium]
MARAAKPQGGELLGRLTRSADFQALRRGPKIEGQFGRMRAVARARGATSPYALRIGLIVPGKLGNSPQRNRIKRRLREGVRRARASGGFRLERLSRMEGATGADIGIFASRAVLTMNFDMLARELEGALEALMHKLDRPPI